MAQLSDKWPQSASGLIRPDVRCGAGLGEQPRPPSKRINVVQDRGLPQHDPPDHMGYRDVIGEDRRKAGASGRQTSRHAGVVELDANDEWRSLDIRRRDGKAADLGLTARNRLQ